MGASDSSDGSGQPVGVDKEVKAFVASVEGFTEAYIPAISRGKARYIAIKSLMEAGYTLSAQFRNVRVRHLKDYDAWAKKAAQKCYSFEQVMDSMRKLGL